MTSGKWSHRLGVFDGKLNAQQSTCQMAQNHIPAGHRSQVNSWELASAQILPTNFFGGIPRTNLGMKFFRSNPLSQAHLFIAIYSLISSPVLDVRSLEPVYFDVYLFVTPL
jgi:hypothetical protein